MLWELLSLSEPYKDKPAQSIPGIVGWGGERPSVGCLSERLSQEVSEGMRGCRVDVKPTQLSDSDLDAPAVVDQLVKLVESMWMQVCASPLVSPPISVLSLSMLTLPSLCFQSPADRPGFDQICRVAASLKGELGEDALKPKRRSRKEGSRRRSQSVGSRREDIDTGDI